MLLQMAELGSCYTEGWGCTKSPTMGAYYLSVAAERGSRLAANSLALYFTHEGLSGFERSYALATEWFRKALQPATEATAVSLGPQFRARAERWLQEREG